MAEELIEVVVKTAAHSVSELLTPVILDEAIDEFNASPPRTRRIEERRRAEKHQSLSSLAFGGCSSLEPSLSSSLHERT